MLLNKIILFRIIGLLEGLSYILLVCFAVPLKYWGEEEKYVKILGMPLGLLFILYLILAFLLRNNNGWNNKDLFIILLGSLLPFGTFYVDQKYFTR